MKLFLLLALSTFSVSTFAGSCEDLKLKDNVSICYSKTRTIHGKNSSSQLTHYYLEYSCTKKITIQGDSYKDARLLGKYANKDYKTSKVVSVKKSYQSLSYCKQIADHIETNGEYPVFLDRVNMYGNAIGI